MKFYKLHFCEFENIVKFLKFQHEYTVMLNFSMMKNRKYYFTRSIVTSIETHLSHSEFSQFSNKRFIIRIRNSFIIEKQRLPLKIPSRTNFPLIFQNTFIRNAFRNWTATKLNQLNIPLSIAPIIFTRRLFINVHHYL